MVPMVSCVLLLSLDPLWSLGYPLRSLPASARLGAFVSVDLLVLRPVLLPVLLPELLSVFGLRV